MYSTSARAASVDRHRVAEGWSSCRGDHRTSSREKRDPRTTEASIVRSAALSADSLSTTTRRLRREGLGRRRRIQRQRIGRGDNRFLCGKAHPSAALYVDRHLAHCMPPPPPWSVRPCSSSLFDRHIIQTVRKSLFRRQQHHAPLPFLHPSPLTHRVRFLNSISRYVWIDLGLFASDPTRHDTIRLVWAP